ncbi:MAG: DMT family transporter [Planctomycetes bacterium]|nr:DMT family transporter [Planctomycetota bacterium]
MTTATAPTAGRESGIGYMVQSAFWFAVMGLLVKLASAQLPTLQIVFVRGVLTICFASTLLAAARVSPFGGEWRLLLTRGLVGSCAMICFYAAVVHLPLAEATVVHQTAPLWTAIFAAVVLHERISARVLVALGGAFAGVVLIAKPQLLFGAAADANATDPADHGLFAFVALLGAVLSAVAYVTVRRLGRSENPLVVTFWLPLLTIPVAAPWAVPAWVWPDAWTSVWLVGIGASTQIAQLSLTKGLARETAGRATAVGYLQVAFAAMFSGVFLGTWPDASGLGGMALIVAALLVGTRR